MQRSTSRIHVKHCTSTLNGVVRSAEHKMQVSQETPVCLITLINHYILLTATPKETLRKGSTRLIPGLKRYIYVEIYYTLPELLKVDYSVKNHSQNNMGMPESTL